jgi:hypothetical protein
MKNMEIEMDKVIKKIIIKKFNIDYIYEIGYNIYMSKIYVMIEIYKDDIYIGHGGMKLDGQFVFFDYMVRNKLTIAFSIGELFNNIREVIEVSEEVEKEYEKIYLIYKLNDFNKI